MLIFKLLNVDHRTYAKTFMNKSFYCQSTVLWHCWLGDRKGIRPVKNWMLVCW